MEPETPVTRKRGRPSRVVGQPATARRWVFLTALESARLDAIAKANGQKAGEYIRDVITNEIAEADE